MTWKN